MRQWVRFISVNKGLILLLVLLAAVMFITYWTYGNWRAAMVAGGVLAGFFLAYILVFRLGMWLLEAAVPNVRARTDHRGVPVQLRPVQWNALDLTPADRLRLSQWSAANPPPRWIRLIRIGGIVLWITLWFGVNSMMRLDRTQQLLLLLGVGAPLFIVQRRFMQRLGMERQARALLAIERCPACTYNLTALAKESDGCAVCPECGAAWKLGMATV